jgi:plasmid stabilization system protein ParE
MAFRVELTERATRNLRRIYLTINAEDAVQARAWFNGPEKLVLSLSEHPPRAATSPEDDHLRQLLDGRNGHRCRIIYAAQPYRHGSAYPSRRARSFQAG